MNDEQLRGRLIYAGNYRGVEMGIQGSSGSSTRCVLEVECKSLSCWVKSYLDVAATPSNQKVDDSRLFRARDS